MKIQNSGQAITDCGKIQLQYLMPGVVFSTLCSPFSLHVKLENGDVLSLPSFKKIYGYEAQGTTEVIPHTEAVLTVAIGQYDPTNEKNLYYKEGTEPLGCRRERKW